MNIKLTCGCGRAHEVPVAMAGTTMTCPVCGHTLSVPALGIAVPAGKRAAPPPRAEPSPFALLRTAAPATPRRRTSSTCATALLLIVAGLVLLATATAGLWHLGMFEHWQNINPAAHIERPAEAAAPAPPEDTPAPPAEPVAQAPAKPEPAPPIQVPLAKEPAAPANKPVDPAPPVAVKPVPIDEKKQAVPVALPRRPLREGDTFLQDVLVTQKSRFLVQGIPVATLLQYRIVSRYTIDKVQGDGMLNVQQKVEAATLLQADDLTQGLLAGPVAQLPGTAFALKVGPRGDVTHFAGAGGAMQAGVARLPGGLGVQMASLLDADGWKELAQATFYQPEDPAKPGRWQRPLTHSWGALGSWTGDISYAYPGPGKAAQVKVPYTLKIGYRPPKGPGAPGALPLQIMASKFQPPQAGGVLLFDSKQGKTIAAEERFAVRGAVVLMLLGQNTPAEVEEEQLFQMRIVAK